VWLPKKLKQLDNSNGKWQLVVVKNSSDWILTCSQKWQLLLCQTSNITSYIIWQYYNDGSLYSLISYFLLVFFKIHRLLIIIFILYFKFPVKKVSINKGNVKKKIKINKYIYNILFFILLAVKYYKKINFLTFRCTSWSLTNFQLMLL